MEKNLAEIEIKDLSTAVDAASQFICSVLKATNFAQEAIDRANQVVKSVLEMLTTAEKSFAQEDVLQIQLRIVSDTLQIGLRNLGLPLYLVKDQALSVRDQGFLEKLAKVKNLVDSVSFLNAGQDGQLIQLALKIPESKRAVAAPRQLVEVKQDDIEVRSLRPGEEGDLSRLFYQVYGYHYINDFVYYPDKIKAKIASQELISLVAVHKNNLVAHVALVKKNDDPPVYESALGVVDPRIKSQGLFGRVFKETMTIADKTPMRFCVYDFVTNHDYSQRLVAKYGTEEMAIFIGCQDKEFQANMEALGIGQNPKHTDRYSLLLAIKRQCDSPFGKEVVLPVNLGEIADFILEPLGIEWRPAARFVPLAPNGRYEVTYQPAQRAAIFDLVEPGAKALKQAMEEWRFLVRRGYQYAAIEMSLSFPGVGQVYDYLGQFGFFIAGFVPYRITDKLGFRFQFIGPARVDFDEIKLYSERGRKLLNLIREDYEKKAVI
ncbi:MAG: hypothetical protein AB7T49_19070 [Oligoflexales bacterium]